MNKIYKILRPIKSRQSDEKYRVATQLELFFDLVIVISFAFIAKNLHHSLIEGYIFIGIVQFIMTFIMVWWPWNLFTWFASSFDNDDPFYRITVMIMMFGSLIIAASLSNFLRDEVNIYSFIGYMVMRLAYIIMWLRVAYHNIEIRNKANLYIIGQIFLQCYWFFFLFAVKLEDYLLYLIFVLGVVLDMTLPFLVEKKYNTNNNWHRHHIIERFGLLNIIVLGEILLSSTLALQTTFSTNHLNWYIISYAFCGIIIAFVMWWLYFAKENYVNDKNICTIFHWGYGHIFIFAAGVATGAGLEVLNDSINSNHLAVEKSVASWALSLPIALYIFGLWYVREKYIFNFFKSVIFIVFSIIIAISPLLTYSPYFPTFLIILCLLIRQNFLVNT